MFVSINAGQITVSINGLSFADILYTGKIKVAKGYKVLVDQSYTTKELTRTMNLVKIF
jgi:hypothetical protein